MVNGLQLISNLRHFIAKTFVIFPTFALSNLCTCGFPTFALSNLCTSRGNTIHWDVLKQFYSILLQSDLTKLARTFGIETKLLVISDQVVKCTYITVKHISN